MSTTITQLEVDDALTNAVTNGYYPQNLAPERLADDLIGYTQQFGSCEPEDLLPLVKDWQSRNPAVPGITVTWDGERVSTRRHPSDPTEADALDAMRELGEPDARGRRSGE